ncbi:MAG: nicotinate (nicotinamide) nucleotide adenylyltransferase [Cyclobacteriaceae bacterium]|nr:nicotinate (nicotinamide) nucleotide adenylyltransferase [Cyclobacteriaceae bacterium]
MKIGLFFGSFNPVHTGHMIIANIMVETTDIEKVWFVVSPQNPFKKSTSLAHEQDRFDMVRAAAYENYKFHACDIEFSMPKPSYTVDTLAYLSEKYKEKEFSLILGEDNLFHLENWKNASVILNNYLIYVYPRPNAKKSGIKERGNIKMVEAPYIDISATFIRKLVKEGKSIQFLVPTPVEAIIRDRGLFK